MMADERLEDPTRLKIFPRNLTARADYIVRGNPTNSRPESGVDNCYPGLEFDQRNLDQNFFTGLHFEFQRADGAILAGMRLTDEQRAGGLGQPDVTPARPLYLWFLYGRTMVEDPEPTLFSFAGQSGMEVWRRVHDLLPGRLVIMLGPGPGFSMTFDPTLALTTLKHAYQATTPADRYAVARSGADGSLEYAVLSQDRAPYLDEEGVIDVNAYAPGELTKTMCAPWMYDFRDCYCFYWASNKPDIVDSADGKYHDLNFIRRDRSYPPPHDVITWEGRRHTELTYADMVQGWWHELPVVLNDRETITPLAPRPEPPYEPLTRSEVIAELTYLATVEHALAVEYLFARYSVDAASTEPPPSAEDAVRRIWFAADQVFQIAVDEMRHFLWANDVLNLLGAPPATGRAARIAEPPGRTPGRKVFRNLATPKQYLDRPFELAPLTKATLEWFISVEAPSRVINEGLDGMYVELLRSIGDQPRIFSEGERILPMIKLIVDEGEGHWTRFVGVRDALHGIEPERYLRRLDGKPTPRQERYLHLGDQYYRSILEAIAISFSMGEHAGRDLVQAAIRSMYNLDDIAQTLARQGVAPRFDLPDAAPPRLVSRAEAGATLQRRETAIREALSAIQADPIESPRAERHRQIVVAQFEQMRNLVNRAAFSE